MRRQKGVSYFSCSSLKTRHVYFVNDHTNYEYNDRVFDLIKVWIHNILPTPDIPPTPSRLAEKFATYSTQLLSERGFLMNVKEITFHVFDENEHFYKPVKQDPDLPIVRMTSEEDKFYSQLHTFRPTVQCHVPAKVVQVGLILHVSCSGQ